eukprot:TRINITY_DN77873_c0_g1_i1.p1 TRINITY_DN77873_c0_g1~~TRINITY_DN77873_c0_g1_i1.p1  ORF type:complete len:250 (-),score=31.59 TRINITY_DN77873_c0_g1_i1:13-762(-)
MAGDQSACEAGLPPAVADLLKHRDNQDCFDCDASCADDPWVSVSHGTIVCLSCAGVHRSLGVHVSFVRSLKLDRLKESELRALLFGGNAKLRRFLEDPARGVSRRVFMELPIEARYHTPACELYRRRLHAKVDGLTDNDLPTDMRCVTPPPPPRQDKAAVLSPLTPSAAIIQPIWTADADALRCELCRVEFTAFLRRHHCRRCGRCVCNSCTPVEGWRPLPEFSITTSCRQCKVCSPPAAKTIPGLEHT